LPHCHNNNNKVKERGLVALLLLLLNVALRLENRISDRIVRLLALDEDGTGWAMKGMAFIFSTSAAAYSS